MDAVTGCKLSNGFLFSNLFSSSDTFCSWNVFLDLRSQNYILLSENERNKFGQRIPQRYHRISEGQIVQLSDPMETGEFRNSVFVNRLMKMYSTHRGCQCDTAITFE